ncbi:MAG TPA: hypothetical protein VEH57_06185 [Thermoplasmata archaeon]|nr:hypothetical protein [Thermoplasmata archaeon]
MDERRFSRTALLFLIVVVLIGGGIGAGVLYVVNHPKAASGPPNAQLGDNLTVNYIGMFGAGPQQGRVFDTSYYSVATNNATYPKSLEFTLRGGASSYTPLAVNNLGPSSGLITGFWQGLLGLPVNQTRVVTIPVGPLGYWPVNQSCLLSRPLSYQLPTVASYTPSAFTSQFPGITASTGLVFSDPLYLWNDLVLSQNATEVVVENLPSIGWTSAPFGWSVTVTNVSSSSISLSNDLSPANAGLVLGHSTTGFTCGSAGSKTQFIVSSVNLATGTYVEDYNSETTGATLVFYMTVVTISS